MGVPVHGRRGGDGDPFLSGPLHPARVLATSGFAASRLLGRHVTVAVGVGRAGVYGVREDAVDGGGRPGMPAGARMPGAFVEALRDLADTHPLLHEPSEERPDHPGLLLVHYEVAGDVVPLGDVAVAVGSLGADVMPLAGLLQLAAPETFGDHRPLVLGDRALYLQQELVVGVLGDGMMEEHDLAAMTLELLQQ